MSRASAAPVKVESAYCSSAIGFRFDSSGVEAVRAAHLFLDEARRAPSSGPEPLGAAGALEVLDALPQPQWGASLRARVERARARLRPPPGVDRDVVVAESRPPGDPPPESAPPSWSGGTGGTG
jgi:hypothetical protein